MTTRMFSVARDVAAPGEAPAALARLSQELLRALLTLPPEAQVIITVQAALPPQKEAA